MTKISLTVLARKRGRNDREYLLRSDGAILRILRGQGPRVLHKPLPRSLLRKFSRKTKTLAFIYLVTQAEAKR